MCRVQSSSLSGSFVFFAIVYIFYFYVWLFLYRLVIYGLKWLLLHVLFNYYLCVFSSYFLFVWFYINSQQFHSIARQISFSFSLAVPVNELSSSETRLITTGSGVASPNISSRFHSRLFFLHTEVVHVFKYSSSKRRSCVSIQNKNKKMFGSFKIKGNIHKKRTYAISRLRLFKPHQ